MKTSEKFTSTTVRVVLFVTVAGALMACAAETEEAIGQCEPGVDAIPRSVDVIPPCV